MVDDPTRAGLPGKLSNTRRTMKRYEEDLPEYLVFLPGCLAHPGHVNLIERARTVTPPFDANSGRRRQGAETAASSH